MNAILTLCHFCELHGPRIVFNTQVLKTKRKSSELSSNKEQETLPVNVLFNNPSESLVKKDIQQKLENLQLSLNIETCHACQSFPNSEGKIFLLSKCKGGNLSFISSQYPLKEEIYSLTRQAGIRSLSCETYSEREGPIYFGDDARGHVISYIFYLKDGQARGFLRRYSILVLMKDKMFLMNSWTFFIKYFEEIINKLQESAAEVYKNAEEKGEYSGHVKSEAFKRHRSVGSPRPLSELVGDVNVWKELHSKFAWILQAGAMRLQEKMVQGAPLDYTNVLQEFSKQNALVESLTISVFETVLHHLFTGKKVSFLITCPNLLQDIKALFKRPLPSYLFHPKELYSLNDAKDVEDKNILLTDSITVFESFRCLKVLVTDLKASNSLSRFTAEIVEETPIRIRLPQIVTKISRLYADNKFSTSLFDLYLASLIDEWNNKVAIWAFLLDKQRQCGEALNNQGAQCKSLEKLPRNVSSFVLSVGALECDVPLLDALVPYHLKYS